MSYSSKSNRACNFKFKILIKSLARLLTELYNTQFNYYYLQYLFSSSLSSDVRALTSLPPPVGLSNKRKRGKELCKPFSL